MNQYTRVRARLGYSKMNQYTTTQRNHQLWRPSTIIIQITYHTYCKWPQNQIHTSIPGIRARLKRFTWHMYGYLIRDRTNRTSKHADRTNRTSIERTFSIYTNIQKIRIRRKQKESHISNINQLINVTIIVAIQRVCIQFKMTISLSPSHRHKYLIFIICVT